MNESLTIAEELYKSMKEYDSFLKDKFLFYYYNALVINYSKLDPEKAITVLDKAKKNTAIQTLPIFGAFIYLNMGLIYYSQKKYKISAKQFSRLILQKDFLSLSLQFQLKIAIAELVIRYHLNQTDLIEKKIKKIRRDYKKTISQSRRDGYMLIILNELIYCNNIRSNKIVQAKIKEMKSIELDDNYQALDIINYNDWVDDL